MRYNISGKGRRVGALGIQVEFVTYVEADSPETAVLELYNQYEHLSPNTTFSDPEGTSYTLHDIHEKARARVVARQRNPG